MATDIVLVSIFENRQMCIMCIMMDTDNEFKKQTVTGTQVYQAYIYNVSKHKNGIRGMKTR